MHQIVAGSTEAVKDCTAEGRTNVFRKLKKLRAPALPQLPVSPALSLSLVSPHPLYGKVRGDQASILCLLLKFQNNVHFLGY